MSQATKVLFGLWNVLISAGAILFLYSRFADALKVRVLGKPITRVERLAVSAFVVLQTGLALAIVWVQ